MDYTAEQRNRELVAAQELVRNSETREQGLNLVARAYEAAGRYDLAEYALLASDSLPIKAAHASLNQRRALGIQKVRAACPNWFVVLLGASATIAGGILLLAGTPGNLVHELFSFSSGLTYGAAAMALVVPGCILALGGFLACGYCFFIRLRAWTLGRRLRSAYLPAGSSGVKCAGCGISIRRTASTCPICGTARLRFGRSLPRKETVSSAPLEKMPTDEEAAPSGFRLGKPPKTRRRVALLTLGIGAILAIATILGRGRLERHDTEPSSAVPLPTAAPPALPAFPAERQTHAPTPAPSKTSAVTVEDVRQLRLEAKRAQDEARVALDAVPRAFIQADLKDRTKSELILWGTAFWPHGRTNPEAGPFQGKGNIVILDRGDGSADKALTQNLFMTEDAVFVERRLGSSMLGADVPVYVYRIATDKDFSAAKTARQKYELAQKRYEEGRMNWLRRELVLARRIAPKTKQECEERLQEALLVLPAMFKFQGLGLGTDQASLPAANAVELPEGPPDYNFPESGVVLRVTPPAPRNGIPQRGPNTVTEMLFVLQPSAILPYTNGEKSPYADFRPHSGLNLPLDAPVASPWAQEAFASLGLKSEVVEYDIPDIRIVNVWPVDSSAATVSGNAARLPGVISFFVRTDGEASDMLAVYLTPYVPPGGARPAAKIPLHKATDPTILESDMYRR